MIHVPEGPIRDALFERRKEMTKFLSRKFLLGLLGMIVPAVVAAAGWKDFPTAEFLAFVAWVIGVIGFVDNTEAKVDAQAAGK